MIRSYVRPMLLRAQTCLEQAIELEPEKYAPRANLAELFSQLGNTDGAIMQYEVASAHSEVSADLLNNFGIALLLTRLSRKTL